MYIIDTDAIPHKGGRHDIQPDPICRCGSGGFPYLRYLHLTTDSYVVMIANMKAQLIYRHRVDFDDGAILEIVVWRLPFRELEARRAR